MKSKIKEQIQNVIIAPASNLENALSAIDKGGLGIALIINPETESFIGLISDGDVRRALLNGLGLKSSIKLIDRPETISATTDMALDEVSSMFSESIKVIPVLNREGAVVDLAVCDRRFNFPVAEPQFGDSELKYVTDCVISGWVSSAGKYVTEFENQFSQFCETQYAISTSNGTTALHLSLLAFGIGPGDEVIVPSFTFIATANAVTYTGAKPIFVDSELGTWNINPVEIEKAITSKTKAIIPVHLYGHPADMDSILDIAKAHKLAVIEDAAEAHGAMYKGKMVGSLGDVAMFSFYGNKTITTGEGGMIVSDNFELIRKMRIIRDHGMDPNRRYWHNVLGYNYRLTNIQAALGVAQMERIDQIIDLKRRNAKLYGEGLQPIPGVTLPPEAKWAKNIYWLFSILIDEETFGMSSEILGDKLKTIGIDTRPLFPPVHKQPIYNTGQKLPICEKLSHSGLSLPSSVNLNKTKIKQIINAISDIQKDH
jgi:perosamine synthetase